MGTGRVQKHFQMHPLRYPMLPARGKIGEKRRAQRYLRSLKSTSLLGWVPAILADCLLVDYQARGVTYQAPAGAGRWHPVRGRQCEDRSIALSISPLTF